MLSQVIIASSCKVLPLTLTLETIIINEHIMPIFLNLHWLPIRYRIMFKILLITYKALNILAPSYVRDLLTPYIPSRQPRSSSKNLLVIPHFNLKTYGARSFPVAAPTLWNNLPSDIMNSSSVKTLTP